MIKNRLRALLQVTLVSLGLLLGQDAVAMPPTDEVIAQLKASGQFEQHVQENESARRRGVDQPDFHRLAAGGHAAVVGNLHVLVLLVDFSDNPASAGTFTDTTYFKDLLFSTNVPHTSMNDMYQEMSYGLVSISGIAVNWIRLPQTYAYYVNGQRGFGSYPHNAQKLALDAVDAAEAQGVDFSLYDNDGDGSMDGLFIVHAGPGYEETGNVNQIHSHAWSLATTRNYDGVSISSYTMEPEEQASGLPVRVGVFCHEYGHFLGLPDLYDTDYSSSGVGRWCLMSSGSWGNGGTTPSQMSIWCKYQLGWVNPVNVSTNLVGVQIPQIETNAAGFRMWAAGALGNQYFLVENRQKTGFDAYLPGEGLLIWHIDDSKSSNDQEWYPGLPGAQHYWVAVVQADGNWNLEHGSNSGDAADPWPGGAGKTEFSDFSTPNSKAYSGNATGNAVWNISAPDSMITANLDIFYSQPYFSREDSAFTDLGNHNGRPDPGESASLVVYERNLGALASDVAFLLTTNDLQLTFSDSTSALGSVGTGALISNSSDPFDFSVPSAYIPRIVEFYLTVTSSTSSYSRTDTLIVHVGPDQVLLVDDDARLSPFRSYDTTFIMPVLDSLRVPYAHWEVKGQGTPGALANYPAVVWYTGDRRIDPVAGPDTTLTPSERAAIAAYLDQGGHLLLTGQQVGHMLDVADSAFLHNYLHAAYGGSFADFIARGVDGDVVGDQTSYVLGGAGGAGNQLDKDLLIPVNGGVPAFTEDASSANITGIRYEGSNKVLFLGWGVEGIGDDLAPIFNAQPKSVLISRAIDWLVYNAVFSGVSLQPLVVNPGSDATHLMDTAISLHWNFSNSESFPQDSLQVQVGSDAEWSVAEHWNYGPVASVDTSAHYAGPPVTPGQTLYWRVRVFSGGAWSAWANSFWHMNAAPAAPQLTTPADSAAQFSSTLSLHWAPSTDPDPGDLLRFRVRVDTQPNFATAVVYDSLTTDSLHVSGALATATRYYWRVTVFDKGGLEATSPTRTFLNLLAGDVSGDGLITAADIVKLVNYIFKGGPAPAPPALGDVNASCTVTSADVIYLVNFAFKSGAAPLVGCAGP